MPTVTFRALADFRDAKAAEFKAQHAKMIAAVAGSDPYFIAVDKMLRAADDCHAAHAELTNHSSMETAPNPHQDAYELETYLVSMLFERNGVGASKCPLSSGVWGPDIIAACRAALGTSAEEAYERAEAAIEDAALSRFHYDAFGEGRRN